VHLIPLSLQFGKVCELFDEIGLALSRQCRDDVARIAECTGTVTACTVLAIDLLTAFWIRIQLQCSSH
jgi:hypothetical protein